MNHAFGSAKKAYKKAVRKALKEYDLDALKLQVDTYESTLEEEKQLEKIKHPHSCILWNWERIYDWREAVTDCPEEVRNLRSNGIRSTTCIFSHEETWYALE